MSKVIQIRDVPDDVHDRLAAAAAAEDTSLTRFLARELEHIARRAEIIERNAAVARETQHDLGARLDRATILAALRSGRDE